MSLAADVAATLQPGFAGVRVPDWVAEAHAAGLVSVCLYGDNVPAGGGLDRVCADLHERLPGVLLAVDEEGGDVTRLHYPEGSPTVGNAVLGRLDDEDLTRRSAAGIGAELAALGIGLDLAPVVDVNSSPENPVIGVRSLGADAIVLQFPDRRDVARIAANQHRPDLVVQHVHESAVISGAARGVLAFTPADDAVLGGDAHDRGIEGAHLAEIAAVLAVHRDGNADPPGLHLADAHARVRRRARRRDGCGSC